MKQALLVLNAGSSSIKFGVFRGADRPTLDSLMCEGQCEGIGHGLRLQVEEPGGGRGGQQVAGSSHADALRAILDWLERRLAGVQLAAAGHRVVHGGAQFVAPVRVDAQVLDALRGLQPLAPLHQPHNLAAMDALAALHPSLPQVACFDTAFHHTQPPVAAAFALPRALRERGIRRYGFHGLSYEYVAGLLPGLMGERAQGRVVVAHLGSGASLCALRQGRSVATTMGFSALDGLPMGRRCGALDPGVVLYLMQELKMSVQQVSDLLYRESGLLGVSGLSDDLRTLLASPEASAREAVDLFIYRIGRELGSLAAALGGLDALVFTAGVGENAAQIRQAVCESAAWLGLRIDLAANVRPGEGGPRCISEPDSPACAWVVPTHEDLAIARHSWDLLRLGSEQIAAED